MINGNNIFISFNQTDAPFAATKSDEIQTECDLLEKSSPYQGKWREYVKNRKGWSFTTSWLVGNVTDIHNLLTVGQEVTISVYGRDEGSSTKLLTGSAICTQCKVSAQRGNICNGSFAFKGNGELEAVNISSSQLESVNLQPLYVVI